MFVCVPYVCLFGFLWLSLYCWFSRRFVWFSKNLLENNNNKNKQTISKGGSETFKNCVFLCLFSLCLLVVFSLVVFCIFGFLEGFFGLLNTFGKTSKNPRVGLKPLRTLCFWFSRRFFWLSFVFFGIFGFLENVFGVLTKPSGKPKQQKKQQQKKTYPRVGLKPLRTWCVWFSQRFFLFSKNLREKQNNKQYQTHIQTQGAQGRTNSLTIE